MCLAVVLNAKALQDQAVQGFAIQSGERTVVVDDRDLFAVQALQGTQC